ncbi:MAG: hypothetical protein IT406_00315 [Candidatus Yanofskybacteria bacterium]|nr:hypothetical protein [Candidatus Yanofskybacteria bacterium]
MPHEMGAEVSMGQRQRSYPVELIASHIATHNDEFLDHAIGVRWGAERLPGFASAPVVLLDAGLNSKSGKDGWWYLERRRTACIGILGGPFDEHGELADGVRENAATKMAKFVGVADDPALARMLEYSLRADRDGHDSPFELASLIKACWMAGMSLERMLLMYGVIFDALYRRDAGELSFPIPPGGFRRLLAEWVIETIGCEAAAPAFASALEAAKFFRKNNSDKLDQILKFEGRKGAFADKRPFDLEGIWEAMVASGVSSDRIRLMIFAFLQAKYQEQTRFIAAVDEFLAISKIIEPTSEMPYLIGLVKSDNDQMKRAAAMVDRGLDVLIQRRSSGRVNVFDLRQRLPMGPVIARLRYDERLAKADPGAPIPAGVLRMPGTLRQVPEWFGFYGCHNGTLTAPNRPVTRLPFGRIARLVEDGLAKSWAENKVRPWRVERRAIDEQRAQRVAAKATA